MPTEDRLSAWHFELPADRIATRPAPNRTASRLMHLPIVGGSPTHLRFDDLLGRLNPGDLLVANDSRVMACRLEARRATGGAVELLLLEPGPGPVRALARPARKLQVGEVLALSAGGADQDTATVTASAVDGIVQVELSAPPAELMERHGSLPLPPYLRRQADQEDTERYQTVYAGPLGAAAAPTAGLHFDEALLARLRAHGVGWATVTLHVGLGTFRPLRDADLDAGRLHEEWHEVPPATAEAIARARAQGGRIIAVGTTTVRTLEARTPEGSHLPAAGAGVTDLFIQPPYAFRAVDGMITNFHLPRSSLLMLVAAWVGRERLLAAYDEALQTGYRFYSYGDAMLLL